LMRKIAQHSTPKVLRCRYFRSQHGREQIHRVRRSRFHCPLTQSRCFRDSKNPIRYSESHSLQSSRCLYSIPRDHSLHLVQRSLSRATTHRLMSQTRIRSTSRHLLPRTTKIDLPVLRLRLRLRLIPIQHSCRLILLAPTRTHRFQFAPSHLNRSPPHLYP